ncbi:hypothetical protein TNCV_4414811 [Trichonephila clavipes]|uniref:Uncharacterized protein n=1 Tax=Trichonephila clavipes TaxID=2585209 RepID=A0A8X6S410_TRICX|nr:hypothetical protein TNCV_4414811 [Trichonephila clavipes]
MDDNGWLHRDVDEFMKKNIFAVFLSGDELENRDLNRLGSREETKDGDQKGDERTEMRRRGDRDVPGERKENERRWHC